MKLAVKCHPGKHTDRPLQSCKPSAQVHVRPSTKYMNFNYAPSQSPTGLAAEVERLAGFESHSTMAQRPRQEHGDAAITAPDGPRRPTPSRLTVEVFIAVLMRLAVEVLITQMRVLPSVYTRLVLARDTISGGGHPPSSRVSPLIAPISHAAFWTTFFCSATYLHNICSTCSC